ncbi:carboxypeptidase-like regulatory domain-containing protein [Marinilabiliaceae bacterium AAT]|uniref:Carboxypeptidase-like regulatory domain-containing protein n=2 Tax=Plebeiibacterium sediminum TaxID=2992112 RepID=A0AAE3M5S0_9BACT|nr:carboxypeptidase-like regulatory domain-containing protein [Plebeiobacterium sediminum]
MKQMKYYISVFLILSIAMTFSHIVAQNFTVKGVVLNAETNMPVEFANIGVENTYLGTASDLNGYFELELSNALSDKTVMISAVGYKTKSFAVSNWVDVEDVKIQLIPMNYDLSEVDVTAKSKIGYGIIKSASNLISDNYNTHAFSYKCFLNTSNGNGNESSQIFLMTDKTGYQSRTFTDAFENRNYKVIENSKQEEPQSFSEGLTFIDQVINSDIVRCPGNILSTESVSDFEIKIEGTDVFDGDSVWVISYESNKPTIQNCGDPNANSYSGKIWITVNNNVILKNSSVVTRNNTFIHGNDFNEPQNAPEAKVQYETEVTYRKSEEGFILNTVDYKYTINSKVSKVFLKVIDVIPFDGSIKGRQYFNNEKYNSHFWNSFKKPE